MADAPEETPPVPEESVPEAVVEASAPEPVPETAPETVQDVTDVPKESIAPVEPTDSVIEDSSVSVLEGACGVAGSGSWWGGWIQAAKDKSVSALEFVKQDLKEFTNTMQVDSNSLTCTVRSKLNQETANAATQKVKHGMSMLFDGIKTALIIPPDEMEDEDVEQITVSGGQHIFDRAKARLHAVQIDPGTYCNEPSGSKADFAVWKKTFDLDGKKGEISELLVSHVQVRALYTQMVPSSVSHADFWQRYFYKLYQLDQEEKRRADLKKRAENTTTDDDLAWDDEDDWENMEGGPSSVQSTDDKTQDTNIDATTSSESSQQPEHSTTTNASSADMTSPTDTVSTTTDSTTTDSSNQDVTKDISSAETLTIVSGDSETSEITQEALAAESEGNHNNKDLVTKEKGDIVVVGGDNSGSEGTSPANSDSHNKESTDEDWEKDFDIEVTEEELQQVKAEGADKGGKNEEEEEDWENWE